MKNGLADAAKDFDVQVDYRNPPSGDLADMARLIEQARRADHDGVIVSIADFDLLKRPIELVRAKGIPIVTINSGTPEQYEELGAIMHVGQPEYAAGKAAGKKAKAAGVSSISAQTTTPQIRHPLIAAGAWRSDRSGLPEVYARYRRRPDHGREQGQQLSASQSYRGRPRPRAELSDPGAQGDPENGSRGQDLFRHLRHDS